MAELLEKTHSELAETTERPQQKSGRKIQYSYALLAFVVIACADVAARYFYHPDPYQSPNRSWAWWAVRDFRATQRTPDVAIFGSSLMLAALNDGDSTFLQKPFDAVSHHRAYYLENLLEKKLGKPVHTTSLAIGGQMASDVYALATTLFTRNPKPKAVVWGIAPRDFLDSTFTNVDSSETIRYMNKVAQTTDVLQTNRRILWDRVQNAADSTFYIYGKRGDIVASALPPMKAAIHQLRPDMNMETVRTPQKLLEYAMKNLPEDNGVDQWRVTPYSPSKVFSDNTAEYVMRYQPYKPRVLQQQLSYFERFLQFAKAEHITVTLVNMPLTQGNLKLLPPGAYENYLNKVKAIATKYGATLADYNDQKTFQPGEFADTVHLNGLGGEHFFELVAEQLAASLN